MFLIYALKDDGNIGAGPLTPLGQPHQKPMIDDFLLTERQVSSLSSSASVHASDGKLDTLSTLLEILALDWSAT